MMIAVFWVVAPCSLVEVYQRFRGPCCLHHQGDRQTTRCYNPEDSNHHTRRKSKEYKTKISTRNHITEDTDNVNKISMKILLFVLF
jgi:hypothetical protein